MQVMHKTLHGVMIEATLAEDTAATGRGNLLIATDLGHM